MSSLKAILRTVGLIAALWLLALGLELIPPLKAFTAYLDAHPDPWIGLAWGAAGLGLVLLIGAWVRLLFRRGRPMSQEEVHGLVGIGGAGGGREAHEEISFREVKLSLTTGAWRRDPEAQMWIAGLIGVWLVALGLFGFFFVVGAPVVKVFMAGAWLYAFTRFAWAFARA